MLLVLDTCTERLLVGVRPQGSSASDRWSNLDSQGNHGRDLHSVIEQLLEGAIPAAIGVAVGPGSFTGVRIGLSSAKGLAEGWGIPLLGLDNLRAMADQWTNLAPGSSAAVLPAIDARKKKFYGALYQGSRTLVEPSDLGPSDWVAAALAVWAGPVVLSGYQGNLLADTLGTALPPLWTVLTTGDWTRPLLDQAQAQRARGEVLAPGAGPRYLRLSEAEENLRSRPT